MIGGYAASNAAVVGYTMGAARDDRSCLSAKALRAAWISFPPRSTRRRRPPRGSRPAASAHSAVDRLAETRETHRAVVM